VGRLDAEIWNEFNTDWNQLVLEASRLKAKFDAKVDLEHEVDTEVSVPHGTSEKEVLRKTRIHQAFFRDAILSSYEETCCVTGLRVPECLVASHIVPWSVSEEHRTDPRNGLCLSATFDRLFDRGLITVSEELKVVVTPCLRKTADKGILEMICRYHGSPIVRPRRFLPLPVHLEWHRRNVFRG
jgi:putative restriction endonuclease